MSRRRTRRLLQILLLCASLLLTSPLLPLASAPLPGAYAADLPTVAEPAAPARTTPDPASEPEGPEPLAGPSLLTIGDPVAVQAAGEGPSAVASTEPNMPQSLSLLLAGVVNGGFESGDLTGWTTGGSAAHVEVVQASDFTASVGPVPTPTEGNYFALLCNGPGVVNPLSQGNIDLDGVPTPEYDTSILSISLSLTASDVPATLSFDWSFLTDEDRSAPDSFDDFFQVTLNTVVILAGSRPVDGVSPYLDVVGMNFVAYTVNSTGACNNCFFGDGRNSFQTFRTLISNPGTYTLVFLVADQGSGDIDSGLLIDNVQLIPEIDLEITKTATPDPAIAGEPLIYEITVENHGTGRALDVVVTDTLPIQVEFIAHNLPIYADPALPQGCTFSPGTGPGGEDQLVCDLGDVLGGESVRFEIEVDVQADALANGTLVLTNMAEVDSLTADRNPRNHIVILGTILQDEADLQVAKVSKPDTSVRAGELFTYTIYVDNLGPSHARNVVLTDTMLSSGAFTLLTVTPDPNRPADFCTTTPTSGGTVIACELGESLEPQGDPPRNGRWVITVRARANYAQDVDNIVDVFSADPDGSEGPETATPDPDTSSNRAADFIAVTDVKADLKITKFGKPDGEVLVGEELAYTVIVDNLGPGYANNVAVRDSLVSSGDFELVAINQIDRGAATCVPTSGSSTDQRLDITCQLAALEPKSPTASGRWTIEIVVRAHETQDINNVADVVGDDSDPDLSSNTAAASTTVKPRPITVAVGGISVPLGKFEVRASWVGLAALIISAVAAAVARRRRA